jgi:hypothetical protein
MKKDELFDCEIDKKSGENINNLQKIFSTDNPLLMMKDEEDLVTTTELRGETRIKSNYQMSFKEKEVINFSKNSLIKRKIEILKMTQKLKK